MYLIYMFVSISLFFVIVTSGDSSLRNDGGTYCDGTGWIAYRDEKCYKLIKQWATRDGAKVLCAQDSTDGSAPQLATIKSVDEQTFLTELIFKTSAVMINVWIGVRRQNGSKFVWDDGSEVGDFANWAEGSPIENIQLNCVAMKPEFLRSNLASGNTAGQWRDVPCEMPNYVICEKLPQWSFNKLQQTLLETRKELKSFNDLLSKELEHTKNQLTSTVSELSITKNQLSQSTKRLEVQITETKDKLIPIGFLYTQLSNEKAPSEIWPWMKWQDVSSAYAGVFFRVEGGGSDQFGHVQTENSPRLSRVHSDGNRETCSHLYNVGTVIGGMSQSVYAGGFAGENLCLKFEMSGGEIRPKNVAIRVWRRTT